MRIMIDLETLSLRRDAVIMQIAAVDSRGDNMSILLDIRQPGRHIDPETLKWWLQQEKPLSEMVNGTTELGQALQALNDWVYVRQPATIWACGFKDFEWLDDAFEANRLTKVWSHSVQRDYRTIREEIGPDRGYSDYPAGFVQHDALHDARHQMNNLKLWLP